MLRRLIPIVLLLASIAHADWLKLDGADFIERLPITVSNEGSIDNPAAVVEIALDELSAKLKSAGPQNIAVGDESNTVVPWQVSDGTLIFVIPVKANSKSTVYVYASGKAFAAPTFEPKTGTDIREAWRSFENEFAAFRVEVGDKAKTTGLTLDTFGKSTGGRGAILKQIYASDYHKRQPWGIDTLKVGKGPGLGGVYVFLGDKVGRTDALTTTFDVEYEGPVATKVVAKGPIEIDGKKLVATRVMQLVAGDRSVRDTVFITADADTLKQVQIGLGLRDLPEQKFVEQPKDGYAFVAGKGNQEGTERLGLGLTFNADAYDRTLDTTGDKENDGHIYVLKPHGEGDSVHVHARLFSFWDGDGWINNADDFEKALKQDADITWPNIEIAERAESR